MTPPAPRLSSAPLRRRLGHGGFTIVEVMMGAAVMVLAITTSITTLQSGFVALDTARNITLASQIMQSELERMRLKDWNTVNPYPAGPTTLRLVTDLADLTSTTAFVPSAALASRFTLTRAVSDLHTDMKKIVFTVTWTSYDARPQTRSYTAYYGKNGLYDFYYNTF
jgi:hypothetical protein